MTKEERKERREEKGEDEKLMCNIRVMIEEERESLVLPNRSRIESRQNWQKRKDVSDSDREKQMDTEELKRETERDRETRHRGRERAM